MEILLSNILSIISIGNKNNFQKESIRLFSDALKKLNPTKISFENSFVNKSDLPSVILKDLQGEIIFCFNFWCDDIHINSPHFDIYFNNENELAEFDYLLHEIFIGNYTISIDTNIKGIPISEEVKFVDSAIANAYMKRKILNSFNYYFFRKGILSSITYGKNYF